MIPTISTNPFTKEAKEYWAWHNAHPIEKMDAGIAREGAGSELRSPLFHYGTVLPVYLSVIRYLKQLKAHKGMRLVELGSGTGRVLAYLKTIFPDLEVWGTDYSSNCTQYAQRVYGGFGVKFIHSSAQKTTLQSNSVHFLISSHVIEHISKKDGRAFIAETARVLRKDGYAFIGTPERRSSQDLYALNPTDEPRLRLVPPHEHEYTKEELEALARKYFVSKKVRVDALYSPVFREIFSASIQRFKPTGGVFNPITNFLYTTARDRLPKLWFDSVARLGAEANMKSKQLSYKEILFAITPGTKTPKKPADVLLLVTQK